MDRFKNVDSQMLKDICDPEYPLLANFREKAPGSYKHCQNVAQMCEMIASKLGLNINLMIACSIYHDIGKMLDPIYFSENQKDMNPHDTMEPRLSYHILTRHVSDSVKILISDPNVPREVIEIISKHHGTSVLMAIYNKCNLQSEYRIDDFRYKGAKADNIYSLILMITDCVEATAKAYATHDKMKDEKDMHSAISDTISRLAKDSQIDNLTVGELRKIEDGLMEELSSMYHKRVAYSKNTENNSESAS